MPRWTRFRDLFGPNPGADVDEELAFHVDMRTREYLERGESPDRAREHALSRAGDLEAPVYAPPAGDGGQVPPVAPPVAPPAYAPANSQPQSAPVPPSYAPPVAPARPQMPPSHIMMAPPPGPEQEAAAPQQGARGAAVDTAILQSHKGVTNYR